MESRHLLSLGLVGLLAGGVAGVASSMAQSAPAEEKPELVDRVVAVVDEDPILESEVRQVIELRIMEPEAGEEGPVFRRRVLDRLIEQRLRFHEIDSFGFVELPMEDVEDGFDRIRQRFDSERQFSERLAALGLEADSLRQLVARQLMVLTFVDERLGPRVFVDLDDIRSYYEDTLTPEMRRRGAAVPPLSQVREDIRAVLKEQRLNEEIASWTEELRRQADVEDYFDEIGEALPGVVATSDSMPAEE